MVDILLATFNGAKFLSQQIDSILNQTVQDFNIIIRDDGSSDGTVDIIKEYCNRNPHKITFIEDEKKCGNPASNFMEIAKYSKAEYVMFCDQDDYWYSNKIELSLKEIKKIEDKVGNKIPILVYGNYEIADAELNIIDVNYKRLQIYKENTNIEKLLVQNYVTGCLTIMNRILCKYLGEFNHSIKMHDWWAAQIASSCGVLHHFDCNLMLYRQHGNNVVGSTDIKSFKYRINKFFDKKTRSSQRIYEEQAQLLFDRFEDKFDINTRKKIISFLSISKIKFKLKRIHLLRKGGFLKSDFIRRIGQYFYI